MSTNRSPLRESRQCRHRVTNLVNVMVRAPYNCYQGKSNAISTRKLEHIKQHTKRNTNNQTKQPNEPILPELTMKNLIIALITHVISAAADVVPKPVQYQLRHRDLAQGVMCLDLGKQRGKHTIKHEVLEKISQVWKRQKRQMPWSSWKDACRYESQLVT
jgi:hypothetical protein